jgi:hypothetical protein
MSSDEHLSGANPDLVKRRMRRERIQKGAMAAASVGLVALAQWLNLKGDKKKS